MKVGIIFGDGGFINMSGHFWEYFWVADEYKGKLDERKVEFYFKGGFLTKKEFVKHYNIKNVHCNTKGVYANEPGVYVGEVEIDMSKIDTTEEEWVY